MFETKTAKNIADIIRSKLGFLTISIIFILFGALSETLALAFIIPLLNSLTSTGDFLSNLNVPYLGPVIKLIKINSNLGALAFLILTVMFFIYLSNIFMGGSIYTASRFGAEIGRSLRKGIFSRYLSFGKAFFDQAQLGILIQILTNNCWEFEFILVSMRHILANIVMAGIFLVFLFTISWKMSLLALPLGLLVYYPVEIIVKKLAASSKERVSSLMDLSSYSTDLFSNSTLVKSYCSEDEENLKFAKKNDALTFHTFNVNKKQGFITPISDILGSTGFMVLVLCCLLFYMKAGNLSAGRLLVYFFVLKRFAGYLKGVNEFKSSVVRISAILEKINWVFDDKDKPFIRNGTLSYPGLKEMVEFKNVDFGYTKERLILKEINLRIKKGEAVAIEGPTGAGKTTVAHLLCRFYDPSGGSIEIDGVNINNYTLESLCSQIALISQETLLFNDTIRNNIIYGMRRSVSDQELEDVLRKAYLYDFVMSLPQGPLTYIGDKGVKLSGGEKQRMAIARAMLKNAGVLILDEATSALDSHTEAMIQEAIGKVMEGKTTLVIAHRLSTIKNSEWIIVLEGGRITEEGKHEDLLSKKGRFFYYWELQKFY